MPPSRRLRVLVADDTPDFLFLLRAVLERDHDVVVEAQDGEQALAAWRARRDEIDVLVLDHRMPRRTGLQVAAAVLAEDPDAVVLLFTAEASSELRARAGELGVDVIGKDAMPALVGHPALAG